MIIKTEIEQRLKRNTHCLGCDFYGIFGPKCEFRKIITDDLDKYVEKKGAVDCKRPEECMEKFGL